MFVTALAFENFNILSIIAQARLWSIAKLKYISKMLPLVCINDKVFRRTH